MKKFQENFKIEHNLVPSALSKKKNMTIAQENWTKRAIKLSIKAVLYLNLQIGLNIFCERLYFVLVLVKNSWITVLA